MAVVSLLAFENVDDEKEGEGGDDDLLDHIDGMHESLAMNVHGDMR